MVAADDKEGAQPATVVFAGHFVDKGGQHTSGAYHIERRGSVLRLILEDHFRTDPGPDLHVVLSPAEASTAGGDNAMSNGKALVVGRLISQTDYQAYDLPDKMDFRRFRSVLIHCIQYSHLYGAAPLQKTDEMQ